MYIIIYLQNQPHKVGKRFHEDTVNIANLVTYWFGDSWPFNIVIVLNTIDFLKLKSCFLSLGILLIIDINPRSEGIDKLGEVNGPIRIPVL